MVQFFLQAEIKRFETLATADPSYLLSDDPPTLDVRETARQVALEQRLIDVADKLCKWGYEQDLFLSQGLNPSNELSIAVQANIGPVRT